MTRLAPCRTHLGYSATCAECETIRLRAEVRLYRRALRDVRVTASVTGSLLTVADTLTRIHDISRAALARRRRTK